MQQFNKKINLYSMVKSYFSLFLMFILYTFGYSAINNPAGVEEFINSIMSFSPEIKVLSITGTLLLFLILIYEKLSNQDSGSQSSSSSTKGNASIASDVPLSTLAAGTELPDYDIINSSELIDSQPVATSLVPSVINNSVLSITPLELDPHNPRELNLDSQQINILKQIVPVATKVLLCSLIAGIAILSCGLVIDSLIKGQQLLPSILEFTNSISSLLGISSSTLLAVAFVPMVALTIYSILSKTPMHTQGNIERILEKSQSIEIIRAKSKGGAELKIKAVIENVSNHNRCDDGDWRYNRLNPFSPLFQEAGNCSNQQTNPIHQEVNHDDWREDPTNPFSNNYNCTTAVQRLTIRNHHSEGKALG